MSGLATGGIYASLALALVMIYQSTNHINFAQGEMAMFSTYLAWTLINAGIPYWWAFLLTVAISFVAGVVIERVIIRPVEHAPVLVRRDRVHRAAGHFQQRGRLDLHLHHQDFPQPVPGAAVVRQSLHLFA